MGVFTSIGLHCSPVRCRRLRPIDVKVSWNFSIGDGTGASYKQPVSHWSPNGGTLSSSDREEEELLPDDETDVPSESEPASESSIIGSCTVALAIAFVGSTIVGPSMIVGP